MMPLFDRVLVQRVKPMNRTVGGIVLPESAQQKNNEAKVVAVGKGIRNSDGKYTPPVVEVGDHILLPEYRGDEVHINNEDFLLVREEDILAKVEFADKK
uniref:10 kDa chaperonin n=1 Tax=Arcella intermedia TaxID=1963864 RepID=A0A6B2LTI6_9EUKA